MVEELEKIEEIEEVDDSDSEEDYEDKVRLHCELTIKGVLMLPAHCYYFSVQNSGSGFRIIIESNLISRNVEIF